MVKRKITILFTKCLNSIVNVNLILELSIVIKYLAYCIYEYNST